MWKMSEMVDDKNVEVYDGVFPDVLMEAFYNEFLYMHPHSLSNYSNSRQEKIFYHVALTWSENDQFSNNLSHAISYLMHHVVSTQLDRTKNLFVESERLHVNLQHPGQNGSFHKDWSANADQLPFVPISAILMISPTVETGCEYIFKNMETGRERIIPFVRGRLIVSYDDIEHKGMGPANPKDPYRITAAMKFRGHRNEIHRN